MCDNIYTFQKLALDSSFSIWNATELFILMVYQQNVWLLFRIFLEITNFAAKVLCKQLKIVRPV
jgi:hypothetical protein